MKNSVEKMHVDVGLKRLSVFNKYKGGVLIMRTFLQPAFSPPDENTDLWISEHGVLFSSVIKY